MIQFLTGILLILGFLVLAPPIVHAEPSVAIQPLQYVETLQKGERKRAFIDVTNPSPHPVVMQFSVQGFRQVDEEGTLTFFDDSLIAGGVTLDYQDHEIPANKTLRLFFIVDGSKLPSGDVFAAIFANTKPNEGALAPSARVGTLLILTNGTPGVRQAEITSFSAPLFHLGESITGEIRIKNTAPVNTSSGFMPKISVHTWPFGPRTTVAAPLVFAGNTRTVKLDQPSNHFGIYKMTASHGGSSKTQWVVLVTGIWRWIVLIVMAIVFAGWLIYKKYFSGRHKALH